MRVAALVVGCDDYPAPAPTGSGAEPSSAVADAIAMAKWLCGDGGVQAADLRILLSPARGTALPSGMRVIGPADTDALAAEVRHLVDSCSGDRLYVYIAARGCPSTPRATYLAQPLILLPRPDSQVDPRPDPQPDPPVEVAGVELAGVAVEELAGWLAQVDFGEVVTIIDGDRGARRLPDPPPPVRALERAARSARLPGTAMQFRIEALPASGAAEIFDAEKSGGLTAALLAALRVEGPGTVIDGSSVGHRVGLRWSALEPYLRSVLPRAPFVAGPNPSMVLAPFAVASARCGVRAVAGAARSDRSTEQGDVHLWSPDPNAMLIVEDTSGARCAVGVGSIAGRLPTGDYTAVLADPCGKDPRIPLAVRPGSLAELALGPRRRVDGFRATAHRSLTWSSPAAQLALATSEVWARGHQSFLLVGGAASVPPAELLLEGFPDRFASHGVFASRLPSGGGQSGGGEFGGGEFGGRENGGGESGGGQSGGAGWWAAVPVHGPWHTVGLGDHRITVPAAPDSVSAIAITAAGTTVALFDTTHPEPDEIAAQDRVQEYLAIGRLGAADLTSRSSVQTGQRWPWGASAAVRRLIDRTRSSRQAGDARTGRSDTGDVPPTSFDGTTSPGPGSAPPFEFRSDVPPDLRRLLVGGGPWAVWLDWPPADPWAGVTELPSELGAG